MLYTPHGETKLYLGTYPFWKIRSLWNDSQERVIEVFDIVWRHRASEDLFSLISRLVSLSPKWTGTNHLWVKLYWFRGPANCSCFRWRRQVCADNLHQLSRAHRNVVFYSWPLYAVGSYARKKNNKGWRFVGIAILAVRYLSQLLRLIVILKQYVSCTVAWTLAVFSLFIYFYGALSSTVAHAPPHSLRFDKW